MKRILFVDDEVKILDGIRRSLHADRNRWDMQFAVGGEAALEACQACGFDVVVADMRMPGIEGATLLGQIRDRFPSTARIVLSGYSDIALVARVVPMAHCFLAKPCAASELEGAIERVCALQDILGKSEIRRIVGSVGELPSLSSTYTRLMQAVRDSGATINQVAEIIEEDVAMSAKVLHLANSAYFGLPQHVTNLQRAATYLGMETIKNLAFVSEAFRAFVPNARVPQSVFEQMQRHAQQTAAIAGKLPINPGIRDVTIVAALLHDIGSLFLASKMPNEFCSARSIATERDCAPFEVEEELLGTSHAEIGAYLLGLWGFPNLAVEAIANHHRPTRNSHLEFDSTVVVYVADLLAHELEALATGAKAPDFQDRNRACLEELAVLPKLTEFRELALQAKMNTA